MSNLFVIVLAFAVFVVYMCTRPGGPPPPVPGWDPDNCIRTGDLMEWRT